MERVPVDSSMIDSVGYDESSQELEVEFNTSKVYRYTGVPADVYQGLLAASSKGRYMHAAVIGFYPDYQVTRQRRRR